MEDEQAVRNVPNKGAEQRGCGRGTTHFQPEPIPAAIPPSERGYIEAAPEPGRAGRSGLWLYGDGSPDMPRSILLTHEDIRRLCWFLRRLAESPQMAEGALLVASRDRAVIFKAADHA
jgi:hypothetical protein